jgi:hypothetical protein
MNKHIMSKTWDPASHTQKGNVTAACAQWTKHEIKLIAVVIIAQTQSELHVRPSFPYTEHRHYVYYAMQKC